MIRGRSFIVRPLGRLEVNETCVACLARGCSFMVIDDFDEVGEVERRTMLDIQPMIAEDCGGLGLAGKGLAVFRSMRVEYIGGVDALAYD